ncbi:MAG: PadR family transcriptional regulator [Clostridiales bacterium]|nr:PadR family transcriptional regulator [Clostridiales bacterium]
MSKESKRSITIMLLLGLLTKEDMYGSQLCQEVAKGTHGAVTILNGSLYPILYHMEQNGWISPHPELVGKRKTTVYYHIEPKGVIHFQELKQEYLSLQNDIIHFLESI